MAHSSGGKNAPLRVDSLAGYFEHEETQLFQRVVYRRHKTTKPSANVPVMA